MLKKLIQISMACVLGVSIMTISLAAATVSPAQPSNNNSAVGYWITQDHQDQNANSSVIHITKDKDGKLSGKIVHIFPILGHSAKDLCVMCQGKLHNAPILGLKLVWGFDKVGEGQYANGKVLDPTNGKIYQSKMWLGQNGQQLTVRGFIGVSFLGRSDIWLRTHPINS